MEMTAMNSHRLIKTILTLGIIAIGGMGAATAATELTGVELWLRIYALPTWVQAAVVIAFGIALAWLGLGLYRLLNRLKVGKLSLRTGLLTSLVGALVAIMVIMFGAGPWEAMIVKKITELPPTAAGPPAIKRTYQLSTIIINGEEVSVVTGLAAPEVPDFAPDRVIVRFHHGTSFMPGSGRTGLLHREHNVHMVENPPGRSVAETLAHYRDNPNVIYAEPDYTVSTFATTPSDPAYLEGKQWDMTKIAAPLAWDLQIDSSDTVVAIIDTGIDFNHPDLVDNLYTDPYDSTLHGYTCMNGACVAGGFDDHGHGTHVAGTIGAVSDNGIGVAGINWKVKLLAIKFLSASGSGSTSDAVLGFQKLKELKASGVNLRVTNNSWGGGGYSQALKDAMADLETTSPTTLNVCAAGNSNVNADFTPMYPGAFDNLGILSVLASDVSDVGASFTNYGLASVDLAAPGVNIYSTESMGTCSLCVASGYRALSGTSMASPHVAGVAAALLDQYPNLTAYLARDALLRPESYDALTDVKAQTTSSGGRLNFYKALTNYAFLADPVQNQFPTVSAGPDAYVTGGDLVDFTQEAADPDGDTLRKTIGKGAVSAWLLGWQVNRSFPDSVPFHAPPLARTAVVPYDISVADNRGGGASARNLAVVAPVSSPGSPPSGVLTVPETGTVGVPVAISFVTSDPDNDPVSWEMISVTKDGGGSYCCFTGSTVSPTFSVVGNYRVTVQAMDSSLQTSATYTQVIAISDGASQPSNGLPPVAQATVTPESGAAPLTVTVDLGASTDPDGKIMTYYNGCGDAFATGSSNPLSTCTFTSPGTYWLQLLVMDNTGNLSPVSKYVVVYPGTSSGAAAPTNLMATANSATQISLGWTDNADNEDAFKIERSLDATSWYPLATVGANVEGFIDSGLAPGTSYWYRILASNAAGNSDYSNTATAQTTRAAPSTIQFIDAAYPVTEGAGSVTLWVKRLGTATASASVKYATANGTARSKTDYTAMTGTLTWSSNDTASKPIGVPIIKDARKEGAETFVVTLSSASGATIGTIGTATVTITD